MVRVSEAILYFDQVQVIWNLFGWMFWEGWGMRIFNRFGWGLSLNWGFSIWDFLIFESCL